MSLLTENKEMLGVGIKHDAIPAVVSRITPSLKCHILGSEKQHELDLFSPFPLLCSFGPDFILHSTFLELQDLYQFFVAAGHDLVIEYCYWILQGFVLRDVEGRGKEKRPIIQVF